MFYSMFLTESNTSIGQYSSEDAALRAATHALRAGGAKNILTIFQESGEISLKSSDIALELTVKPSNLITVKSTQRSARSDGERFMFAGRPSNNGWYRSGVLDEIDKSHISLAGRHVAKDCTAAFIDRDGVPLIAFEIEAQAVANSRRGTSDIAGIAMQLCEQGRLGSPPEGTVALFLMRGNGAALLTVVKRYASPGECPPNTKPASRVLGAEKRDKWFVGENLPPPSGDEADVVKYTAPKKRGRKPKMSAITQQAIPVGMIVTTTDGARVPHGTKPLSEDARRQLELKYLEENGG